MRRLNTHSLAKLFAERGTAVVLFGSPEGEATMRQAVDFAEAWVEAGEQATFGYVDAFEHIAAARDNGVRVLPTMMIVRDGQISAWMEGAQSSVRIIEAIRAAQFRDAA